MAPAIKPQSVREIAAIHMAAGKLGMDTADKSPQSDYRAMLQAIGGATSAKDLTPDGRRRVLAHLAKAQGLPAARPKPKDGWRAERIVKLWARLAELKALRDPSDVGMRDFIHRQTRVTHERFLGPAEATKVIEALKAWVHRAEQGRT